MCSGFLFLSLNVFLVTVLLKYKNTLSLLISVGGAGIAPGAGAGGALRTQFLIKGSLVPISLCGLRRVRRLGARV